MLNKIKETIGVLLILTGIITCMCETAEFEMQFPTMCIGMAITIIGAVAILAQGQQEEFE